MGERALNFCPIGKFNDGLPDVNWDSGLFENGVVTECDPVLAAFFPCNN